MNQNYKTLHSVTFQAKFANLPMTHNYQALIHTPKRHIEGW